MIITSVVAAAVAIVLMALGAFVNDGIVRSQFADLYDDGVLSNEDIARIDTKLSDQDSTEAPSSRDDDGASQTPGICGPAEDLYRGFRSDHVGIPQYARGEVVIEANADEGRRAECTLWDGSRLGEATVSVMAIAALGSISTLAIGALWAIRHRPNRFVVLRQQLGDETTREIRRLDPDYELDLVGDSIAAPAIGFALLVGLLSFVAAGEEGRELHLCIAIVLVTIAVGLAAGILFETMNIDLEGLRDKRSHWVVLHARVRYVRFRARLTVVLLSAIFAVAVAVMVALNVKRLATHGAITLNLEVAELGGVTEEHVGIVTVILGFFFALLLAAVAGPALLHSERIGSRALLEAPDDGGDRVSRPGQPIGPKELERVARRNELGVKLGLTSSASAWVEQTVAIVFPLLTGVLVETTGVFV
ncbi:MAG: hypothetical protein AAF567_01030 [Actinomycetota bacterium]